jgi:hypothetical protein
MSNKNLTILGIAAVLMASWAIVQSKIAGKAIKPTPKIATYLIQGLEPAAIASIIVGTDPNSVKLNRVEKSFVVANLDNYPAEMKVVNDLITNILDMKTLDIITSNPDNFTELQVVDNKYRSLVKFFDKDGKLIAGVIAGKRATNIGGTYVRMVGSNDVYTVERINYAYDSAMQYVKKTILELKEDDIASVFVTDPNGSYTLNRDPAGGEIVLSGIKQGQKGKPEECKQIFGALENLSFESVMNESSVPKNIIFDRTYSCMLKDSTIYALSFAKSDGKTLARCRAEFSDTNDVVKENKVESKEELKRKEAKLLGKDNVDKFNKNHLGWVYVITPWRAEALTKKLADLTVEDPSKKVNVDTQSIEEVIKK